MAPNNAAYALNAQGGVLEARLLDIPMRVREVALHDVWHGVTVALMIAQVHSGHDLHPL